MTLVIIRKTHKLLLLLLILAPLSLITGCNTLNVQDDHQRHISNDPLQGLNRGIYAFNQGADKLILKPVAKGYSKIVPNPAKKGVSHFFSNLGEPLNVVNNLLQGKVDHAISSTYRFVVNSTLGVFGLFDVAKSLNVEKTPEDFGQTLAAWGVGPGPYLMLPFAGPSNFRDGFGSLIDGAIFYPINEITDTANERTALIVTDVVSLRAGFLGVDDVLDKQLDPYGFLKQAAEKSRIKDLYDGNPPLAPEEDYDF
ncbi:MAG: phospholipid-binding lipoprotein MlaA [Kiritimatiellia bacterium]|jgi:phospholipid-binding lipoprotein MlaA